MAITIFRRLPHTATLNSLATPSMIVSVDAAESISAITALTDPAGISTNLALITAGAEAVTVVDTAAGGW